MARFLVLWHGARALLGFFSYRETVANLRNLDLNMVSRLRVRYEDHESLDTCQTVTTSTSFLNVDFVLFSFLYGCVSYLIIYLVFYLL